MKHTTMIFRIFQSTFPRGERPNSQTVHKAGNTISIHVPAWGTTTPQCAYPTFHSDFNPRSRVGNDRPMSFQRNTHLYFNPRSRVGNDGIHKCVILIMQYFNPRSRVGNDDLSGSSNCFRTISIHVPAWGTTGSRHTIWRHIKISIHVPAWGTTYLNQCFVDFFIISIHVPAWGTTH